MYIYCTLYTAVKEESQRIFMEESVPFRKYKIILLSRQGHTVFIWQQAEGIYVQHLIGAWKVSGCCSVYTEYNKSIHTIQYTAWKQFQFYVNLNQQIGQDIENTVKEIFYNETGANRIAVQWEWSKFNDCPMNR